jgi:uncharacterized protein with HEPN domain
LSDIVGAGRAVETFTAVKSRADYIADLMLRSAVERQFEILGEALRRLAYRNPDIVARISEHQRIIAFRNLIAHGYDALDTDVVWQVIVEKLPVLLAEAESLLRDLDTGQPR